MTLTSSLTIGSVSFHKFTTLDSFYVQVIRVYNSTTANAELQFPRNDISFIQEIGTGWFGMVIESEAKDIIPFPRRCKVLVKFLREGANDREQMRFLDEARVYRDSNHKNILKLLGHCIEVMPYLLILEHYPRGNLKDYLLQHAEAHISTLDSNGAATRRKMALGKSLF